MDRRRYFSSQSLVGQGLACVVFATGLLVFSVCGAWSADEAGDGALARQAAFFERRVRPLLVESCYKCHGEHDKKRKAGLRLDSLGGMLHGGDTGAAIVPGQPDKSLLIEAVSYENVDLQMPPKGKLTDQQIADLRQWIKDGAHWPGQSGEAGHAAPKPANAFDIQKLKAEHWAWGPVVNPPTPKVMQSDWPADDVDRFILSRLEARQLAPAAQADRRTLIRRAYFDVIGLPPSPKQVQAFVDDPAPVGQAFAKVVDDLLESPHFGEKWARHWMDLFRYAESRGHEFDYNVPNAWRYRDYLIHTLNEDVPYDQFVKEHIAGDLLPQPRVNPQSGANESIVATGFWFLGEWVHSPVDIRQDEADRFDNMIDVMTKSFLGMTVACARCHDHKFDAISTQDFYALQGFLQSSNYRLARFETMEHNRRVAQQLAALDDTQRPRIAAALADAMTPTAKQADRYLLAAKAAIESGVDLKEGGDEPDIVFEDFESPDYDGWQVTGDAFLDRTATPADLKGYLDQTRAVGQRFVHTHNRRNKDGSAIDGRTTDARQGTLTSQPFTIDRDFIQFHICGGAHTGKTCVNLVIGGKVVESAVGANSGTFRPVQFDVRRLRGKQAVIQAVDNHRSGWGHIGLDHIVFSNTPAEGAAVTPTAIEPSQFTDAFRQRIAKAAGEHDLDAALLGEWVAQLLVAAKDRAHPLHAMTSPQAARAVAAADDGLDQRRKAWHEARAAQRREAGRQTGDLPAADLAARELGEGVALIVDYANPGPHGLLQDGFTFGHRPLGSGDLVLHGDKLRAVTAYGAAFADPAWEGLKLAPGAENDPSRIGGWVRAGRTLRTPSFEITTGKLSYLMKGAANVYVVVDSHRVNNGPLHGQLIHEQKAGESFEWRHHRDLSRYIGHRAHVEFSPQDGSGFALAMVVQGAHPSINPLDQGVNVALSDSVEQAMAAPDKNAAGADGTGQDARLARELGGLFEAALPTQQTFDPAVPMISPTTCRDASPIRGAALVTDWMLQHRDLFIAPASPAAKQIDQMVAHYKQQRDALAAQIKKTSAVAMAIQDGSGEDEYIFIRGRWSNQGDPAPRGFLEALTNSTPFEIDRGSGRLKLAQTMVDPQQNPLIGRVIVNRIWHHLFGRGIVASVDNFGVLGQPPTHPQLLDRLAHDFTTDHQWSVKQLIRRLLLTRTYQMTSTPSDDPRIAEVDPTNALLHRMRIRRLNAEAIRDSILAVSGRLDAKVGGPSVPVHLTSFMEGRGRPRGGPLDGAGRRSLYISIRRNFLPPMMLAFDMPIPFSAVGRRTVSNVPAQALILMNDPFVVQQAEVWAKRVLAQPGMTPAQRINDLYLTAYARPATSMEIEQAMTFLQTQATTHGVPADQALTHEKAWADLCHVLMNVKEFVFVR